MVPRPGPAAILPPLGSPTALLPLLICAGCPVRLDCLREALEDWSVTLREADRDLDKSGVTIQVLARGVWGGSLDLDRIEVRQLRPDDPSAGSSVRSPAGFVAG